MDNSSPRSNRWLHQRRTWNLRLWTVQFVVALYAAAVARFVLGTELGPVVDVMLPMQLFFPVVVLIIFILVSTADGSLQTGEFVLTLLGYALTPFAATTAYALFSNLYGYDLAAQSVAFSTTKNRSDEALSFIAQLANKLSIPHSSILGSPLAHHAVQFILAAVGLLLAVLVARLKPPVRG